MHKQINYNTRLTLKRKLSHSLDRSGDEGVQLGLGLAAGVGRKAEAAVQIDLHMAAHLPDLIHGNPSFPPRPAQGAGTGGLCFLLEPG